MKKFSRSLSFQLMMFVFLDMLVCTAGALLIFYFGKKIIKQWGLCTGMQSGFPACELLLLFSILLMMLLFISTAAIFFRKRLLPLRELTEQVEKITEENSREPIHTEAKGEIAELTDVLERMRKTVTDRYFELEEMQTDHQKLAAEMSHDMRTPLTALMMYLDLMRNDEQMDPDTRREYLDKCGEKAVYIKSMMDDMFSYFKMEQEKNGELLQVSAPDIIYPFVDEISLQIEQSGFDVEEHVQVPETGILFCASYMNRIAGNIVSNIRKYADQSDAVRIYLSREEIFVRSAGTRVQVLNLTIRNKKKSGEQEEVVLSESMGIGLRNIRKMMEQMAGDMQCAEDRKPDSAGAGEEVCYEIRLLFRTVDIQ